MANKTCEECKFYCDDAAFCSHYGVGWKKKSDMVCKDFEPIPKPTVFNRITASPEVLAPSLVYCHKTSEFKVIDSAGRIIEREDQIWASTILPGSLWTEYDKALAATVAKLKEVVNERS